MSLAEKSHLECEVNDKVKRGRNYIDILYLANYIVMSRHQAFVYHVSCEKLLVGIVVAVVNCCCLIIIITLPLPVS